MVQILRDLSMVLNIPLRPKAGHFLQKVDAWIRTSCGLHNKSFVPWKRRVSYDDQIQDGVLHFIWFQSQMVLSGPAEITGDLIP
jgi:hypothetical protein